MEKDYYKILEVEKDATLDEIKSKYRHLASIYHPDVSDDPEATKKMALINEAYDTLKDPDKRRNYDMYGSSNSVNESDAYENYNPSSAYYEYNRGFVFTASPFKFIRRIIIFLFFVIILQILFNFIISRHNFNNSNNSLSYNYSYYSKVDNTIIFDGINNINIFNRPKVKEVIIESTYLEYEIVGISSYALSNYFNLETVKIPSSIFFISDYAFYNSPNIKYVIYEGTKEEFEKIKIGKGNDFLLNAEFEFLSSII